MIRRAFAYPGPAAPRPRIYPVFIPHLGCPGRCIFCDQRSQTGSDVTLKQAYAALAEFLKTRPAQQSMEIGFYGGTFTGLPGNWALRFISLASEYKTKGTINKIRCSTRPDALSPGLLKELSGAGLDMVEVGVQSFDSKTLELSCRGYDGNTAAEGCRNVVDAGLDLGIQLLPGLPGHDTGTWIQDVFRTITLKPASVRIYPCLVLQGTELEHTWRSGGFTPWPLQQTLDALVTGLREFWRQNIPVIRLGLPPEPELVARILGGPWHPALGSMVKSRVLFETVRAHRLEQAFDRPHLLYPGKHQGELWGERGELKPLYAQIGLPPHRVGPWDRSYFLLHDGCSA